MTIKTSDKGRRGATLAELAVVIGVVAIVITMVLSFSTLVSNKNRISRERLAAMDELQLVESAVENWANAGYDIKALRVANGILYCDYKDPSFNALTTQFGYKFEQVVSAEITNKVVDSEDGDVLYVCTVSYEVDGDTHTHTFCVNSYVGEEVQ